MNRTHRTQIKYANQPRSYALDKLEDVSGELKEWVLKVLKTMPVSQFLKVTYFITD